MCLKLKNCIFSAKEVKYLRMIIGKGGVQMDSVKLKAIQKWSSPETIKAVWSFLGFCNFYWKFIPFFSYITHPLLDLTKQTALWTWGPNQEKMFRNLKATFTQQLVLTFCYDRPFFSSFLLYSYASVLYLH